MLAAVWEEDSGWLGRLRRFEKCAMENYYRKLCVHFGAALLTCIRERQDCSPLHYGFR